MLPDTIETDRLTLRPFSLQDAEAVFEYASPPEWGRYQRIPSPYTRSDAERSVAESPSGPSGA